MAKCFWTKCGEEYKPIKKNQRFCRPECRHAYNNWLKTSGIHLAMRIQAQLQEIADAHSAPIDEMVNVMLDRILNPDGRPLSDEEIYGKDH